MLSDSLVAEIRRLFYAEHWRVGTIAAELGTHHESVRRAIGLDGFVSRSSVRPSALDPYIDFIRDTLRDHPRLRATRLLQMIQARGYKGSATQLRRRIRQLDLRPRRTEAFLRLSMADGEQAQVDWAHIGTIPVGAHDRPLYAFVMVLSSSRAAYVDVSFDMTAASVVRGHVRAFEHFGGVPRACLYDNMKTVVAERIGDVIRYHPRILELASHYHFAPRVCRPRRGNEKGRVERAIRYLRESFLAARVFTSLDDVRRQFADWTRDVAERRPWPQDPAITVREAFERERPRLLPLPKTALDAREIRAVCAHKQPYIQVDSNQYSIPHDVVGKPITLEISHDELRFLDGERLLTTHVRSWERRKVIEKPEHIATLKAFKRAARHLTGRERLIAEAPAVERLYAALANQNELMAPQTRHLTLLLERYGANAVEEAIEVALLKDTPRAAAVEKILAGTVRAKKAAEQAPLPLPKDPRALADVHLNTHRLENYDDLGR